MNLAHHLIGRPYTAQLWRYSKEVNYLAFNSPRSHLCQLTTQQKELDFNEFIPFLIGDNTIDCSTRDKYAAIFNLTKDGTLPVLTEKDVAGLDNYKLIKFIEILDKVFEQSPHIPTYRIVLPIRRFFLTHSFHKDENWMGLYLAMDLYKHATSDEERKELISILKHHDEIGFIEGRHLLALTYYEGRHISKDFATALALLEINVRSSYTRSMNLLGSMLRDGDGVKRDIERAGHLFHSSGLKGDSEGYILLAGLHKKGLLEKSEEKVLEYYHEAEKLDSPIAAHNVACAYFMGKGCAQNYQTALKYFTRAATLGFTLSQINLGNMYFNGYGTEINLVEARKWYAQASEKKQDAIHLVRAVDEKLEELKKK